MEDVTALTRSWFQRVWNDQDEAAIYELMHPDAVFHGLGLEGKGPASFIPFYQTILKGFDDSNVEIFQLLSSDNEAMGHAVYTGIHHDTKTPVAIEFSFSVTWQGHQIIEAKNVVDYLPMLTQLQLHSQDILGKAFQSKKQD